MDLTREQFLSLGAAEVARIVSSVGRPRVGAYASDGNRRVFKLFRGYTFSVEQDWSSLLASITTPVRLEMFFAHGIQTMIVPIFAHGNLERLHDAITQYVKPALDEVITGPRWLDFYRRYQIRVRFYGDVMLLQQRGYDGLVEAIDHLQWATAEHTRHLLLFGIACSNVFELPRLVGMGADFAAAHGRKPTRAELIDAYYGVPVDDVEFFMRATAVRDSDLQPLLVSGPRTQLYFPVAPDFIGLTPTVLKTILYDLIYCRDVTLGRRQYTLQDLTDSEASELRAFYVRNRERVLGIGRRIGSFWVPASAD